MKRPLGAAARWLALFLGYGAVAVAATWPLARLLPWATTYFGDPFINSWILSWITSPDALGGIYDAPIFHPEPLSLTFSENLFGLIIVAWPLSWFFDALTVHNVLLLLSFPLTGLATYALARATGISRLGSILSGLLFMMHPWRLTQLPHLQFEWALWFPLTMLAVIVFCRKPTRSNGFWMALCFLLNGLSNLHYFAFSILLVPLTMFLLAPRERKFWIRGGVSLGASAAILAVVLWPYRKAADHYGVRTRLDDLERYSAQASDWLVGAIGPESYRSWIIDPAVDPERWLFPGVTLTILTLLFFLLAPSGKSSALSVEAPAWRVRAVAGVAAALALVGMYRIVHAADSGNGPVYLLAACVVLISSLLLLARRSTGSSNVRSLLERSRYTPEHWAGVSWIVVGFVGSLGVNSFLHPALSEVTTLFGGIRAPARWAVVAYLGMAVLAGAATDRIVRAPVRRTVVQIAIVLVVLFELWPGAIRYQLLSERGSAVTGWLSSCDDLIIAELPIDQEVEYRYLLGESAHQLPTVNGVSGFEPPFHATIREMWNADPISADLVPALTGAGVTTLILHADEVRDVERARDWLQRELDTGRLEPVARFAGGWKGDWVLRVTEEAKDQCPVPANAAVSGVTATQMLDLENTAPPEWAIGYVDTPGFNAWVEGPLVVSGWVVSPKEISSVSVLLDHRRLSFDVERSEGPELAELFGPMAARQPRFRTEIPRPKDLPEQTDLQVKIVDELGEVTWLPQIWFTWIDPDAR